VNQRESTTESSDDATYGRSLTYWPSEPPCYRSADHSDRIDVQENGRPARFLASLRVEDRPLPKGNSEWHMFRVLVQQESEIGAG